MGDEERAEDLSELQNELEQLNQTEAEIDEQIRCDAVLLHLTCCCSVARLAPPWWGTLFCFVQAQRFLIGFFAYILLSIITALTVSTHGLSNVCHVKC